MKTRVIPAQVTTVEDKIAGNLNFTQILLLIASLLVNTGIYVTFPEPMKFTLYKIPLILVVFLILGGLAFRIKDRVVLGWIVLLATYHLRPRIYVFDKNCMFLRDLPKDSVKKVVNIDKVASVSKQIDTQAKDIDFSTVSRSSEYAIKFSKDSAIRVNNS